MEKRIKFVPFEIIKKETEWIYSKFDEIVISSRVRLARNIKGYPFPYNMTYKESEKIEKFLIDIFFKTPFDRVFIIDVFSLEELQKNFLVERHLISKEFSESGVSCKSIFIPEKNLTIMINEEDHLRIQSIYPGLNLKKCFMNVNEIDDLIEEKVEYAFLPGIGYLTSCLTNTGTGLRASVLVNIPGIKFLKRYKTIFKIIEKIGITIRGFYGEGSLPLGSIYQFSSTELIGKSEKEIIKELENVIKLVKEEEKKCIEEIKSEKKLREKVIRNLLKEKKVKSDYKKLYYLVSLAYNTGLLEIEKEELKKLFFLCMSENEISKEEQNYHFYKNEGKILKKEILETINV